MIIFRQKDFGLSDSRQDLLNYLVSSCHTIAMEFIKAIDLYWYDNQDVSHWVDKPTGYILRLANKIDLHYSLICSFADSTIRNLIGVDGLSIVRNLYNTPEEFIQSVFKEILDDNKYKIWIKDYNFFKKPKEYIRYFKYITLCISGHITPEDWDNQSSWIRKQIPKESIIKFYKTQEGNRKLHELLTKCIENILGIQ